MSSVKRKKNKLKAARSSASKQMPAVIEKDHSSSSGVARQSEYALGTKDWSKVCSMSGENRREFLTNMFQSREYSNQEIADLMAKHYNLPKFDLATFELDQKTVFKVPRRICEKYGVIPIQEVGDTIVVAFSDPGDIQAKDDLSLLTNAKIQVVVGQYNEIKNMIDYHYRHESGDKIKGLFSLVESSMGEDVSDAEDMESTKVRYDPTVRSVDHIIRDGIRLGCSDIHVEVYEKQCRVRFRVDGHLSEYTHPPIGMAATISSRIKVISRLDISEKRLPQDGRLKVKVDDKVISFRVSIVPVVSGEKIVLRILDTSALGTDISDLGMNKGQLEIFQKYLNRSQGLILMTGPTGSGKTTTIYAGLQQLNTPDRNISTAEDPVEYKLYGINQVQVNAKIGLTFASVLRSFLRQDPDVILVGEIRDHETANIAYRASATGHLVLSTLHTNDAASTITRLVDIGLPAYTVAENTSVVVAQRLLRVLCNRCKSPQKVDIDFLQKIGFSAEEAEGVQSEIYKSVGCRHCNSSGYKGRVAVFEVLDIFPELKFGIFKGMSPRELKMLAIDKNNLQTLRKSALEKLVQGVTSVDEVVHGTLED